MRVTIYTKPGCHLCEDALDLLDKLTPQYGLEVEQANILDDMALYEAMHEQIPVIVAEEGQYGRLVAPITEPELRAYLEVVRRDRRYGRSVLPAYKESALDRTARWIGKHWLKMALVFVSVFVALPWLAPVFARLGWWDVANPIYTAYALTCHQLPERAGTVFGYQVAFCYRNTAIYGGFIVFGALYGLALLSTLAGKHGSPDRDTEVPRAPLVDALRDTTALHDTRDAGRALWVDADLDL